MNKLVEDAYYKFRDDYYNAHCMDAGQKLCFEAGYEFALSEHRAEPSLYSCPKCGGVADNGHDRCLPPTPYWCSKCSAEPRADLVAVIQGLLDTICYLEPDLFEDGDNFSQERASIKAAIEAMQGEG